MLLGAAASASDLRSWESWGIRRNVPREIRGRTADLADPSGLAFPFWREAFYSVYRKETEAKGKLGLVPWCCAVFLFFLAKSQGAEMLGCLPTGSADSDACCIGDGPNPRTRGLFFFLQALAPVFSSSNNRSWAWRWGSQGPGGWGPFSGCVPSATARTSRPAPPKRPPGIRHGKALGGARLGRALFGAAFSRQWPFFGG